MTTRCIGRYRGDEPGPTLLCVAGVHGNEPGGLVALRRVFDDLDRLAPAFAGELVGIAGNLAALARGRRYLDQDLNRMWDPGRIEALRNRAPGTRPRDEEAELLDLHTALRGAINDGRGPVYFLDLHTTSSRSVPFGLASDTPTDRSFAMEFGVPIVLGLAEHLDGVLALYASAQGWTTMHFEGGPHDDPSSIDHHEAAIWVALAAAGILIGTDARRAEPHRRTLAEASRGLPRVLEIVGRHAISRDDGFGMLPDFENFHSVSPGQPVAHDRRGTVRVRQAARRFLPLYQGQGDDGFFLAQPVTAPG